MTAMEERVARLERYLKLDPQNVNLLIDLARAYLECHQPLQALATIEKALALNPAHQGARFEYGMVQLTLNRVESARATFADLLEDGLDLPSVRYNLAFCSLLQFEPGAALDVLKPLEGTPQLDVQSALLLVQAYYHLGQLEPVEQILHEILETQPGSSEALGLLAQVRLDQERFDEAAELASAALQIHPDNAEAHIALGYVALMRQDTPTAQLHFDRLLERHPRSGRGWIGRGLLIMQHGDLLKAESVLAQGLAYLPKHIGSWNTLAWCQMLSGKLEAAEESLQQALQLDRNFGETHGTLAVVQAMQGKWEDSQRTAKIALRLDSGSFAGNFARVLVERHRGNQVEADELMAKLLQQPIDDQGRTLLQILPGMMAATPKQSESVH